MTHKSGKYFGDVYSTRTEPANQSSNQPRCKVMGQRWGEGVVGEAKTSLTAKSAGGGVQRRGKRIKEGERRTRE